MSTTTINMAGIGGGEVSLTSEQLEELESRLEGSILRPGDDGWDEAVLVWNGMVATVPALVVQPATAGDVVAAIELAREHGLLLSIKGGGHNIAGTSLAEHGLTLDMSRMRAITVDPGAKLAHVRPGCLLQDVDRATQEHGLATVLGFISEVGVAGLTLGGGLGLPDAPLRSGRRQPRGSRDRHCGRRDSRRKPGPKADLFWAIRGAGANLGVVTRFTFRLHDVGPIVYGGLIAWPFERADEILRAYRTITSQAPRELSVWMILLHAPPLPFVPEEWHGRKICAMVVCYSGDLDKTEDMLAPIRALGDPAVEVLQPWPYVQQQSFLDDGEPKGPHYDMKTEYVAELSDGLLAAARDCLRSALSRTGKWVSSTSAARSTSAMDDGAVGNRDAHFAWA